MSRDWDAAAYDRLPIPMTGWGEAVLASLELRGDDVGGIAVHIGSRVLGTAEPGDVIASSTVRDLVAGSGITFDDRGEHSLRGVPEPWRLFAVTDAAAS